MARKKWLKFKTLRRSLYDFMILNYKSLIAFVLINFCFFAILSLGLGGIRTVWFLLWGLGYYLFNFAFFRWYFKRPPYILTMKFFDSLLPAIKVLFMMMLGMTLLAYLPYIPLMFGRVSEAIEHAITLFIGDFMGDSNIYNLIISLILLMMSPIILYRPLMAWVSAVIGRSGSIKNVFKHTSGYYGLFLKILFVFYLIIVVVWGADRYFDLHYWLFFGILAPLSILFNLTLAKTYENLFLD